MQDRADNPKPRMVRKQVLITAEQNRRLKALAKASGKSERAVLREAIIEQLAKQADFNTNASQEGWKATLLLATGIWKDYPEIDDIMQQGREGRRKRREKINRRMRGEEV